MGEADHTSQCGWASVEGLNKTETELPLTRRNSASRLSSDSDCNFSQLAGLPYRFWVWISTITGANYLHPWRIYFDVWQNQYGIVKQNKVKIKIK